MPAESQQLTYFRRAVSRIRTFHQGRNRQICHDGILLNTMPKSGSVYILRSLEKILRCKTLEFGNRYSLIDQIGVRDARVLTGGGHIVQAHLAPSVENLQMLQHFKLKMVLNLRDPRQALLSWVYHLDWVSGRSDASEELLHCAPRPPTEYFGLTRTDKIDWQIENYLSPLIAWVERWTAIADAKTVPILITQQKLLRTNERALFNSILQFHGLDLGYTLPHLARTLEETHYRRADPAEWRQTFTPDQVYRATALIPESLQQRFGWDESLPSACQKNFARNSNGATAKSWQ